MHVDVIIPARYASTRLPGKPLLRSTGKYLVQHVYEQAKKARSVRHVIVATDDPRIRAAVEGFGGQCVMTSRSHLSGTDRIAEVARDLDSDIVVNLQGDEPDIDPAHIDMLPDLLRTNATADVATLAVPILSHEEYLNPNCVKVVCDRTGRALIFSRSPIPHVRDGQPDFSARPAPFLKHVGIYAYRRSFLIELAGMQAESLEMAEKLEQLRVLAQGRGIQVGVVNHVGLGVDTLDDYERFRRSKRRRAIQVQAA